MHPFVKVICKKSKISAENLVRKPEINNIENIINNNLNIIIEESSLNPNMDLKNEANSLNPMTPGGLNNSPNSAGTNPLLEYNKLKSVIIDKKCNKQNKPIEILKKGAK